MGLHHDRRSRLAPRTPPGGILISFETHAQVQDQIRCEERGRVRVNGIAQPVMTYQVIGPKSGREAISDGSSAAGNVTNECRHP